MEAGRVASKEAAARSRGTTVEIRDLFFNTPARRKFMRAPPTEAGHVTEAMVRLALARRDVAFTLRSAGRVTLTARAEEALFDRVALALGRPAHDHFLPVEHVRGSVKVHGVVCGPDHSQATARSLYLFVNGRFVRDRSLAHAVLRAFAGTLPPGRHPAGALFVELPLDRVDVNVHPQKLEVRFADAREVQDALFHAVAGVLRTAPWLGGRSQAPAVVDDVPLLPGGASMSPAQGEEAASVLAWARARSYEAGDDGVREGAQTLSSTPRLSFPVPGTNGVRPEGYFRSLRYIGQHARTYLVCEAMGGALVLVDYMRATSAFSSRSFARHSEPVAYRSSLFSSPEWSRSRQRPRGLSKARSESSGGWGSR